MYPSNLHLSYRDVSWSIESTTSANVLAYATIQSDIFKPTKYGGKYTVTLIPGTSTVLAR